MMIIAKMYCFFSFFKGLSQLSQSFGQNSFVGTSLAGLHQTGNGISSSGSSGSSATTSASPNPMTSTFSQLNNSCNVMYSHHTHATSGAASVGKYTFGQTGSQLFIYTLKYNFTKKIVYILFSAGHLDHQHHHPPQSYMNVMANSGFFHDRDLQSIGESKGKQQCLL